MPCKIINILITIDINTQFNVYLTFKYY